MPETKAKYQGQIANYLQTIAQNFTALNSLAPNIADAAQLMSATVEAGNTLFFCGNGGSAADAQHLAAECVGRYKKERAGISAIALTVDTSAITAIGNDYGYAQIFARQLQALGRAGDLLYAISTSGNSANVLEAIHQARGANIKIIAVTGESGGDMANLCDILLNVPSDETNHIQEMHIAVGHILCGFVEDDVAQKI